MLIRATKMVSLVDMIFLKKLQTSDTKWHVCTHVDNHLTRCNRWFLDTCWPQQVLNGHHLDKPLTRKWHEWHAQTLSNIYDFSRILWLLPGERRHSGHLYGCPKSGQIWISVVKGPDFCQGNKFSSPSPIIALIYILINFIVDLVTM